MRERKKGFIEINYFNPKRAIYLTRNALKA